MDNITAEASVDVPMFRLPWARAVAELAFWTMIAVGVAYWVFVLWQMPAIKRDFKYFYDAAKALSTGAVVYQGADGLALLPPHALVCVQLLLVFSRVAAAWIWLGLNTLSLAASARIIVRETGWRPTRYEAAAILCLPALILNGIYGQCAWLLALPMTLAWRDLRRGRSVAAGFWFGVVTSIKPFLLPLGLLFLWRRRWKEFGSWSVTGLVVVSLGAWWCGLPRYFEWTAAEHWIHWYNLPANASFVGLAARMVADPHPALREFTPLATAVAVFAGAAVTVVSCLWLRRDEDVDRDLAVMFLGVLLAFPLGWSYYLPLAGGPLISVWRRRGMVSLGWLIGVVPLWWPAGVGWLVIQTPEITWRRLAPDSLYLIGLVVLWAFAGTFGRNPADTLPSRRDAFA